MQNIPIRFQGEQQQQQQYDTSRQPQWLGTQQYQQGQPQREQESAWKQGAFQQPQQGQEFQPFKSQQESAWKQGMFQQPQQGMQQGMQQGFQQQQTGYQQQVQWVDKHIQRQDVAVSDITTLHLLLRLSGICYVKEHVLLKLCQDNSGVIRNWHNQVTINNLDVFSQIAKNWNLTLPFPKSLEAREHEIKNQLPNVQNVISVGEALADICLSAHLLQQELTCGYMSSVNEEFKEACKKSCGVLCENFVQLKNAMKNTEQYFPLPLVKTVTIHEGIQSRR